MQCVDREFKPPGNLNCAFKVCCICMKNRECRCRGPCPKHCALKCTTLIHVKVVHGTYSAHQRALEEPHGSPSRGLMAHRQPPRIPPAVSVRCGLVPFQQGHAQRQGREWQLTWAQRTPSDHYHLSMLEHWRPNLGPLACSVIAAVVVSD